MPKLNSRCQALHSSLEASKEKFFEMAEAKSVRFSPIIEETIDDISTASSNMDFFPSGMNFEDAYIASLSKSAKKYHLPNENEQRLLQRRKKGLLALGFVLLLGITGAGIYFVTRELSNQEPYHYSGAAVRGSKPESATKNMTLHFLSYSTTILSSSITKKPSLGKFTLDSFLPLFTIAYHPWSVWLYIYSSCPLKSYFLRPKLKLKERYYDVENKAKVSTRQERFIENV